MNPIIYPVIAMLALTAMVWLALFATRMPAIAKSGLPPHAFATPQGIEQLPSYTVNISNNFKNLCEVPIVFYALCLTLAVSDQVDGTQVSLAWGFVLLRALHSLVQCTYNKVMHRFLAYLGSCLLLWAMLIKLIWATV